jgi:uncharacterized membrane protein YkvA (DUF1232 family)
MGGLLLRMKRFAHLLALIPQLPKVGRLCWRLWRDPRVPKYLKAIPVATVLYALSPIDLIPDFMMPVIGQIDDATLVVLSCYLFIRWSPRQVVHEHLSAVR